MKLKLDDAGHAVVSEGKPVFVADDGKEVAFDYPSTLATISRLNGEAKGHRERAETAEGRLKSFEGIEDPAAALKALTTVKNLNGKQLIDAGEVEKVRAEAVKAVEEKYAPIVQKASTLEAAWHQEKIGNAFSGSKYIGEKLILPGPAAQKLFGNNFKIEDGRMVGYDGAGNKLYSRSKPGELADFEEAAEMLIEQYPYKDNILKGTGNKGDGATGSNGKGTNNGAKSMPRAQFDALDPVAKMQVARQPGFTLTDG